MTICFFNCDYNRNGICNKTGRCANTERAYAKGWIDAKYNMQQGLWRHYEGMYSCNQCNATFYDMSVFCPNCGAYMRGGEDG